MKWVAIPNRSTRSTERKAKKRAAGSRQATLAYRVRGPDERAEAAARTQSLPLSRRRWMKRWLGSGVIADTWRPRLRF